MHTAEHRLLPGNNIPQGSDPGAGVNVTNRPGSGNLAAMNLNLLKRLSEAPGIPGREERVREILKTELDGLFDEVTTDVMGSLIARKRAMAKDAKRVVLACHIDEIGFYVKHVDDKGFIRIQNV